MKKRGQVTIFIIVAIAIVAIIMIFFIFNKYKPETVDVEIEPIQLFVVSCIKTTGAEAISLVGEKGGYILSPENSIDNRIAIYYDEGRNLMPSKEKIESEIESYVNDLLFFCTKNFIDFPDFEIEQGEISSEVLVGDNEVVLNVRYPLSISKGESTHSLKDFKDIKIPVRLGIIYDSVLNITQQQINDNGQICLTCIDDLANEKDLYVEMNDYDSMTIIFSIRDENSKINNEDFVFNFANKYKAVA